MNSIVLRHPMKNEVSFTIPGMTPPSVNSYVRHTRNGGHYKVKAAGDFALAVQVLSKGSVDADEYRVEAKFFLAAKQKGDVDNFGKCVLDSLVTAKIIRSDAAVTQLYLEKFRDRENPRTEIKVSAAHVL